MVFRPRIRRFVCWFWELPYSQLCRLCVRALPVRAVRVASSRKISQGLSASYSVRVLITESHKGQGSRVIRGPPVVDRAWPCFAVAFEPSCVFAPSNVSVTFGCSLLFGMVRYATESLGGSLAELTTCWVGDPAHRRDLGEGVLRHLPIQGREAVVFMWMRKRFFMSMLGYQPKNVHKSATSPHINHRLSVTYARYVLWRYALFSPQPQTLLNHCCRVPLASATLGLMPTQFPAP